MFYETLHLDMKPHPTNTRYEINRLFEEQGETLQSLRGREHEFFILSGKPDTFRIHEEK